MGKITLDVSAQTNQPPNRTGWLALNMVYGTTHAFTLENFTTETTPPYSDPEGDGLEAVRVESLPSQGTLYLNDVEVSVDDEISSSNLSLELFRYVSDSTDTDGYSDSFMRFSVSDEGSSTFTTKFQIVTFVVASNINKAPSSVGDGEAEITLGNTFVFTAASLTSSLNPPYEDPEGNPPYKLLIVSVPLFGILELSGVTVVDDQEIDWTDVVAGNFSYKSKSFPNGNLEGFEFKISDTGSQQYTG
tara:strand:+ start:145 stop:882 length:738 start_codon:yes stop_codon:yes gene_type:complete